MTKVLICGGGIAGLTAAHELAKRGFDVDIVERRDIVGGKARSIDVPGSVGRTGKALPGEHGFRFFPGFYAHMDESLSDIPYQGKKRGVLDNLTATTDMLLSRAFAEDIELPSEPPSNPKEFYNLIRAFTGTLGISLRESFTFGRKMFEFLASCDERRDAEYDSISWWDFIEAGDKSDGYQRFLAQGITRSLVAMKAEVSSTRTIGKIYFQMVSHLMSPFSDVDRIMSGPSNEVMLNPWKERLLDLGVTFHHNWDIKKLVVDGDRISKVEAKKGRSKKTFTADYIIVALPMEAVVKLTTPELLAVAPDLAKLENLQTEWMNGIQFFFDQDIPMTRGHGLYLDSPWALTSISQAQFWDTEMSSYGDGDCKGILSIVISDWKTPGVVFGRAATNCSAEEIKEETWEQLMRHADDGVRKALSESKLIDWFLDDSIIHPNPHQSVNLEPLLINTVDSWNDRPDTNVGFSNAFLASDYVQTNTDLATMESANEAAKRAVNEILKSESRPNSSFCTISNYKEWALFKPLRKLDKKRFARGKKNLFSF